AGRIVDAGMCGYVFKGAVAAIVKERRALAFVSLGSAIRFVFCVESAIFIGLHCPLDVVADKQIEFSVVIKIKPGGTGRETGIANSCACCDVCKLSATEI